MNEFNLSLSKTAYNFYDDFRKPETLRLEYRKFEIVHKIVWSLFGFAVLPLQALIANIILYINFMIVRNRAQLRTLELLTILGGSIVALVFWTVVLEVSGRFHKHSKDNISSWRCAKCETTGGKKAFKKWRKSCRVLSIGKEGVFTVRRISVLKFVMGVVRGTLRCLLTLETH